METTFGPLLRRWRTARRRSQLELALDAEVSTRHLSFLETGRARPSREMVLVLASALDLPLRERNHLLAAAGFAAAYRETPLEGPNMAMIRAALTLLLRGHEPFGAIALDGLWNIVLANEAYVRGLRLFLGDAAPAIEPYQVLRDGPNALRLLFDPAALRPHIVNWDELARHLLARVRAEAARRSDGRAEALLEDLLALAGGGARRWKPLPGGVTALVLPLEIRVQGRVVRLFSTIATLGTPLDVTLEELRIESLHPADEATDAMVRALTGSAAP